MTSISFKNEVDYLATTHETKQRLFDAMCNSILANYNKLAGCDIRRNGITKEIKTPLLRLLSKLEHMAFNLYSPQSIPGFLNRIVTKPAKVIARPADSFDKPNENVYGKGHFRWDYKAYTLDENELQAIRIYLGLHIEQQPKKAIKRRLQVTDTPKPDFNEIADYKERAIAFLQWANTTFTAEFKEHSTYFDDDKEQRDIYTIVLKNATHRHRFTFGQSISASLKGELPTAYDVLACIQKYEVGTFDDFCSDFGYDNDSRKAYKTYKAVLKEWKNIELLFTPEQLEILQEIN